MKRKPNSTPTLAEAALLHPQLKPETLAIIHQFAYATPMQALQMVRCGFELETQRPFFRGGECVCDPVVDAVLLRRDAQRQLTDNQHTVLNSILANAIFSDCASIKNILFHSIREKLYMDNPGVYSMPACCDCPIDLELPYVEAGGDGSVAGDEIRTIGALSAKQFLRAARGVFAEVRNQYITIDEGCSFHIHLSLPGVKHTYAKYFQSALFRGVIEQQLPTAVEERLSSPSRKEYFNFHNSSDKYNFVNKHHDLPTWEFRLFGNVSTYKDAARCLLIAVKAMQSAYRALLVREKINIKWSRLVDEPDYTVVKATVLAKQPRPEVKPTSITTAS